jgi:hypothetical protein
MAVWDWEPESLWGWVLVRWEAQQSLVSNHGFNEKDEKAR